MVGFVFQGSTPYEDNRPPLGTARPLQAFARGGLFSFRLVGEYDVGFQGFCDQTACRNGLRPFDQVGGLDVARLHAGNTDGLTGNEMIEQEISRYWKTVVDTIQDGIIIVDPGGTIVSTNNGLQGITGYDKDELIGESCSVLNCDMCQIIRRGDGGHWCSLFRSGTMSMKRCTLRRKNGGHGLSDDLPLAWEREGTEKRHGICLCHMSGTIDPALPSSSNDLS